MIKLLNGGERARPSSLVDSDMVPQCRGQSSQVKIFTGGRAAIGRGALPLNS